MIRLLVLLALLAAAAAGFAWVADKPGDVVVTFAGLRFETSPVVALSALLALAFCIVGFVLLLRGLLNAPRRSARRARRRRRSKGVEAVARGMVAAAAGDARQARRASRDAEALLGEEPLTLLLKAQSAQLVGDRAGAEATFARMARDATLRPLGLRGLHAEALRRGDQDAARHFAQEAHKIAPLPWAGQAVLEHHASNREWTQALGVVDANLAQGLIDEPAANRQRAVLKTAIALDLPERESSEALRLTQEALQLAPDLAPAAALAGRILARQGDLRRAAKIIETAWRKGPQPDLAQVYVDMRPGDSAADRLGRAKRIARLALADPESALVVARAALDARAFDEARSAMAPLLEAAGRTPPTARACLTMADIEETQNGASGLVREWLSRASRAPRDKAWVADGYVSDVWAPASPVTGALDAFRWTTPPQRPTELWAPLPEPPPAAALPPQPVAEPQQAVIAAEPTLSLESAPSPALASPEPAAATHVGPPSTPAEPEPAERLAATRARARHAGDRPPGERAFPLGAAPDDPGPETV